MQINILDIKKDDVFWECRFGENRPFVALENTKLSVDTFGDSISEVTVRNLTTHETITLLTNHSYTNYAPRLYETPQYINETMPLELIKVYEALNRYFKHLKNKNIDITQFTNLYEAFNFD